MVAEAPDRLVEGSEVPNIETLAQTLAAIKGDEPAEDLATLLLMATELYSASSCICEEKEASYGEDSEQARACNLNIRDGRDLLLDSLTDLIIKIRGH